MVTRRAQEIRGQRSYWGNGHLGGAGSTQVSEPPIRLRYRGGAVMTQNSLAAAVDVVRHNAEIIYKNGKPVPPTLAVICRRDCFNGVLKQFSVGTPVQVINPGKYNSFLVLPQGAVSNPIIAKSVVRPVGKCTDTNERCGNCVNNKKRPQQ